MKIILLSGGSGKRLWPLSNDTRSKQFLKLLNDGKNNYESMVQRIYRQLCESDFCPQDIVVATSASQKDSIQSQIGNQIDLVLEPERRNTFPAIALSSAYLSMKRECSKDEVILVIPVDAYAQPHYFDTLHRMEEAIQTNAGEIVLMGITPTYPSEKYGYIVPYQNQTNGIRQVEYFKEKPDTETAEKLISEGGFWNGGVFAFRLSYMMNVIQRYLHFDNYDEIYRHYQELPKNSFDYEVVEKAKSVVMVQYSGIWKDLGTWNTLSEEIYSNSIGKQIIISEDTQNTHVINELGIPVVVLGINDAVVVASSDGVLVSNKNKSSFIKKYVDNLGQRPMYEERRWGNYRIVDFSAYENKQTITKHMVVWAGKSTSYHRHYLRDEIWTVTEGAGELMLDGTKRYICCGDIVRIGREQLHSVYAVSEMHFIEIQIGEQVDEKDEERVAMDE